MNTKYKPLYPAYKEFYDNLASNYTSDKELRFFETMKKRQQYEFTFSNDLILSEHDNDDRLYIVRHYFDEFEIGRDGDYEDYYAMDIIDAMQVNLKEIGLLDKDMTLLDWLRARDYKGIRYDGNFDNM